MRVKLAELRAHSGAVTIPRRRDLTQGSGGARPASSPTLGERITPLPLLLLFGIGAWAVGVSELRPSAIGFYGLLASSNVWFVLGLAAMLAGFLVELGRRRARGWVLGLHIVALIVAIQATVPLLYGTPEYAWVYKHIGVAQQLALHGHLTDASNIYQLWPALFAAAAAIGALGHVSPLSFATWAPMFFELANALLLLGVFRLLTRERRVAWLAVLLYLGLISWVGQDYFSPQAFGYLLWLAIALLILRFLRRPLPTTQARGRVARVRSVFLAGAEVPSEPARAVRALAVALVVVLYFAIVAAHQLTPYVALAAVAALTMLDLLTPRWLLLALAAISGGYLAPRYSLIAHAFGGLFSGGNPILNAAGKRGAYHAGAEQTTAWVVRGLAAFMWVATLAAITRQRHALGRVVIPAALAFSPFVMLVFQSYGGEAIYRVFLFSAPWCALLIASMVLEIRAPARRWLVTGVASAIALFAGLQGLYGPVRVRAFTTAELTASQWLYGHVPERSLVILADDNFPALQAANYDAYDVRVIPADPQVGTVWVDEGDVGAVERWVAGLRHGRAYVVVSRSTRAYAQYFGWPRGYTRFVNEISRSPGWTVVYRNGDATIYRLDLATAAAATPTAPPSAAAKAPSTIANARAGARVRKAVATPRGKVRRRYPRSVSRSLLAPSITDIWTFPRPSR